MLSNTQLLTIEELLVKYEESLTEQIVFYKGKPDLPPEQLLQWYLEYKFLRASIAEGGIEAGAINPVPLTAAISIITLTQQDFEYSQSFVNIKLLEIYCRSNALLKYSFSSGKVASSLEYRTLPAGASQPINLPTGYSWSGTLYLASASPGAVVEIEVWQ